MDDKTENNNIEKEVSIPCDCGCSILKITNYDNEDISFAFYINSFYAKQDARFLETLKRRCKIIWYTIIGKEYLFEDVSIKYEDFKKYYKELKKLI